MDQFTRADLLRFTEAAPALAVSVYMPTYRGGRDVNQNAIRFKNLMKAAGEEIAGHSSDNAVQQRLAEARQREHDGLWWQRQSDGLAIFLAADRCEMFRLPVRFQEQVVVGPRFHVRPLVPLLQGDGHFYILAASQNSVRLLEGTRHSVNELDETGLPADLRSALNIDEYVSSMQHHATGSALGPSGGTQFHGQGGSGMEVRKKDEIEQFFHRLDRALTAFLGQERAPLVFAGVDYLFPLFRQTCEYPALVDEPVTGSPDVLTSAQLHERAWSVVEPVFRNQCNAALRRYERLAGGDRVAHAFPTILQASRRGQIDTLFIAADADVRGSFEAETGTIRTAENSAQVDLLNQAVAETLVSGGAVLELSRGEMPAAAPAAAILRYPMPPPIVSLERQEV